MIRLAARNATFQAGMHRVQGLTTEAVETLSALMKNAPPAVKLGAARLVLELGTHQHGAEAMNQRIDELDARLQEQARARNR